MAFSPCMPAERAAGKNIICSHLSVSKSGSPAEQVEEYAGSKPVLEDYFRHSASSEASRTLPGSPERRALFLATASESLPNLTSAVDSSSITDMSKAIPHANGAVTATSDVEEVTTDGNSQAQGVGSGSEGGKRSAGGKPRLKRRSSNAKRVKHDEMQEFERHHGDGGGAPLHRRKSWTRLNSAVKWLRPSNKSRNEDFRRLFGSEVPAGAVVVDDYSCAVHREILAHGRMYVCQEHFCFYSNIFGWETFLVLPCRNITGIVREKTAHVIPNAIRITISVPRRSSSPHNGGGGGRHNKDGTRDYFFTSFVSRETSYQVLMKVWQNVLIGSHMNVLHLRNYVCRQWGHKLDRDEATSPCRRPLAAGAGHVDSEGRVLDPDSDQEHGDPSLREASAFGSGSDEDPRAMASDGNKDADEDEDEESNSEWQADECGCEKHDGKVYIDRVIDLKPSALFKLIFTPTPFAQDFFKDRGFFAMEMEDWEARESHGDSSPSDVLEFRKVSYKMPMDIPMGPKFASSVEEQNVLSISSPPHVYSVQVNVTSSGVPMGNAFSTCVRTCITRGKERGTSRLVVTGCVNFRRSMLSMMRRIIEREAIAGMGRHYTALSAALDRYFMETPETPTAAALLLLQPGGEPQDGHPSRESPGDLIDGLVDSEGHKQEVQAARASKVASSVSRGSPAVPTEEPSGFFGLCGFSRLVAAFLGLALLLALFYQYSGLFASQPAVRLDGGDFTHAVYPDARRSIPLLPSPEPAKEPAPHESLRKWMELLQFQHSLHKQELAHWQKLLHSTSVTLVNVSIALHKLLQKHTQLVEIQLQRTGGADVRDVPT